MEQTQKETLIVPPTLSSVEREKLGQEIVDFIVERTRNGLDKFNSPFPGYSEEYIKSLEFRVSGKDPGRVDLTLTGDMLGSLKVRGTSTGRITVGYTPGFANDKAAWNINGEVSRDFLGIAQSDLDTLVENFTKNKERRVEAAQALEENFKISEGINFAGD